MTVPIPTLVGVEELAFTVPDLDAAASFLSRCFGSVVMAEHGEISDRHGSTMREYANADVRAVVQGTRLLRTPFLNLRLLEATYPGQRTVWPMMLDVGGWHLAGYVDDMDAAVRALGHDDVYVLGPGKKPTTNAPEVGEGSFACHCMLESGFHFELLTYPNGRAYMHDFDGRLWNPAVPDRGATARAALDATIPGFRGFEHVSLAVGDLEEASQFFEGVLGCERFYDMGPMDDRHGSGFGAYANVDVRIAVSKVRLFRSPYLNFELIEPRFPGQQRVWPQLLDVGGWQIGVAVGDLDAALEHVRSLDVHLLGSATVDDDGRRRAACLTPFGLAFELIEGAPGPGAWDPAHPDT